MTYTSLRMSDLSLYLSNMATWRRYACTYYILVFPAVVYVLWKGPDRSRLIGAAWVDSGLTRALYHTL